MSVRDGHPSFYPVLMIAAGAALILSSAAWLVQTTRLSAARAMTLSPAVSTPRIPYPDIRRISLVDAKANYDLGMAVFVDVRGEPYYSQGHIPGALSVTEEELDSHLTELSHTQWIITYCT